MKALITRRAGSETPLNFAVVGGTTQPQNPAANTIWIKTSRKIEKWYFDIHTPSGAVEGEVWIKIDTAGPTDFNALKDDGLHVYPIYAKQYVSGAWSTVSAKLYKNGSWANLMPDIVLYSYGSHNTSVTGGWSLVSSKGAYQNQASAMWVQGGSSSIAGMAATQLAVDVTYYNKLIFKAYAPSTSSYYSYVGLGKSRTSYAANRQVTQGTNAFGTYEIDISSLSGSYYMMFSTYATSVGAYVGEVRLTS